MVTHIAPPPPPPVHALGRLVARGARAEVHEWRAVGATAATVIKFVRGDADQPRSRADATLLAEAAGLSALSHRHVIRPLGLAEVDGRLGLVLPRLEPERARAWIARRGRISAGEAVTLLVPLLLVLVHLERRGLHPRLDLAARISLDDVLFDSDGAPVVVSIRAAPHTGVGRLMLPGGGVPAAARRLVHDVLTSTTGGDTAAREVLLGEGDALLDLDELIETVFELAVPAPLDRDAGLGTARTVGAREDARPTEPSGPLDAVVPWLPTVRAIVSSSTLVSRVAAELRLVRRRVWVTTGLVAVSVVVGLVLVGGGGDGLPDTAVRRTTLAGPVAQAPRPAGATPITSAAADASQAATASPEPEPGVLSGDDAEAAATELLRLRAACLRALDSACVAGVDQAASPLMASDSRAISDPSLLAKSIVDVRITGVSNRFGGAVLLAGRQTDDEPASVLVTRTEAGRWFLRSVSG